MFFQKNHFSAKKQVGLFRLIGLSLAVWMLGPLFGGGSGGLVSGAQALTMETVAEGLERPWSLAFLPNGDLLVTEKSGVLNLINAQTGERSSVTGTPSVYYASQGGLLDVVLHPKFAENKWVYLTYAHGTSSANALRVARAKLAGTQLQDLEVLFTVDPMKDTPVHYGGRLVFLPDETFLVTSGDGFDYREAAQDLESLLGKVIRLNSDGSVPQDNPFAGQDGARPEIFSYGHRNPQGLAYDAVRNEIVLHEHGPRGGDEINILEPGKNYGWPAITHGVDYSGATISPYTEAEGMEQPLLYWTPSIAPSGLSVYSGSVFPEWQGDYLVGALAHKHLRRVDMYEGRVIKQEELLVDFGTRIRDVREGPDGSVYILTDKSGGSVISLTP